MWILVIGAKQKNEQPERAVATLGQLGCAVRSADFWDSLDSEGLAVDPPAVVIVEAEDEVDAGRAALGRVRSVAALVEVPALLAVSVSALSRVSPGDGFDDIVLMPYVPAELYVRIRRAEWKRSDFAVHERIKKAMEEGVRGIVYKPFDVEKVLAMIRNCFPDVSPS